MSKKGPLWRVDERPSGEPAQLSPLDSVPSPLPHAESGLSQVEIEEHVARLYKKNATGLFRYALTICSAREIAEDAVQEAFLRYYIAVRNGATGLDARGWLYSTTRNYILDRLKEYYVRNGRTLGAASHLLNDAPAPEAEIMMRELDVAARDLLSRRELECLRLRNEGLRYREIADILRIESATVGVLLGRALKKIRAALSL